MTYQSRDFSTNKYPMSLDHALMQNPQLTTKRFEREEKMDLMFEVSGDEIACEVEYKLSIISVVYKDDCERNSSRC